MRGTRRYQTPASGTHSGRVLRGTFRFLDLPPELRNRVYGFIFDPDVDDEHSEPDVLKVIRPASRSVLHNNDYWEGHNRSIFSILQTCRQVYDEASNLPFLNNFVSFALADMVGTFVGHASPRLLSNVRNIEIELSHSVREAQYWGMLRFFPNLCKLRIVVTDELLFSDSVVFSDGPIAAKIKMLRGLDDLVVVFRDRYHRPGGERRNQYDVDAARLTEMWRTLITGPK